MSRGNTIRRERRGEMPSMTWLIIIVASVVFLVTFIIVMKSIVTGLKGG